jgi:hypothetical protein
MRTVFVIAVTFALVFSACNKKNYGTLAFRFHHFSPNAPRITWVYAGKDTVAAISYTESSDYVTASMENISFIGYSGKQSLLRVSNPNWAEGSRHSVFICDTLGTINKVMLNDQHPMIPAGKALIRFVHLVPDTIGITLLANGIEQFSSKKFRYALKNYALGFSDFEPIDAGVYNLAYRTVIDSVPTDIPIVNAASLENNKVYNLVATGFPKGTGLFTLKLVVKEAN